MAWTELHPWVPPQFIIATDNTYYHNMRADNSQVVKETRQGWAAEKWWSPSRQCKRFVFSLKRPHRFWFPLASYSLATDGYFRGGEEAQASRWPLTPLFSVEVKGERSYTLHLLTTHRGTTLISVSLSQLFCNVWVWHVAGSKSLRPDQLSKVTEIKQLCYFST